MGIFDDVVAILSIIGQFIGHNQFRRSVVEILTGTNVIPFTCKKNKGLKKIKNVSLHK